MQPFAGPLCNFSNPFSVLYNPAVQKSTCPRSFSANRGSFPQFFKEKHKNGLAYRFQSDRHHHPASGLAAVCSTAPHSAAAASPRPCSAASSSPATWTPTASGPCCRWTTLRKKAKIPRSAGPLSVQSVPAAGGSLLLSCVTASRCGQTGPLRLPQPPCCQKPRGCRAASRCPALRPWPSARQRPRCTGPCGLRPASRR